jgi:hypothetical protein
LHPAIANLMEMGGFGKDLAQLQDTLEKVTSSIARPALASDCSKRRIGLKVLSILLKACRTADSHAKRRSVSHSPILALKSSEAAYPAACPA